MILQLAKQGQNKFDTYMHAHNIKDWLLRSNNADRFPQIKLPPIASPSLIISLHPLSRIQTGLIEYLSCISIFFLLQSVVLGVIQLILLFCSSLIFFLCQRFVIHHSPKWNHSIHRLTKRFITSLPSDLALSIFSKQWNAECFYKLRWMTLRSENTASAGPTQQEAVDDLSCSQRLKTSRWQQLPSSAQMFTQCRLSFPANLLKQ